MGTFLTCTQRAILVDLLDQIIPEKGDMPGAGQASFDHVESVALGSTFAARVVLDMLKDADAIAGTHHGKPFSDLDDSAKESSLKMVEDQDPEIFSAFVGLVYSGYYTNAAVIRRLGPNARKPQPTGFPIDPFDPTIVETVRGLGPRYRAT